MRHLHGAVPRPGRPFRRLSRRPQRRVVRLGVVRGVRDAGGPRVNPRFGSAAVLRFAAPTCAVTLAVVAVAPDFGALLAAIAVFGAAFGILEVSVNSQGAVLERIHRPAVVGRHACRVEHRCCRRWGAGGRFRSPRHRIRLERRPGGPVHAAGHRAVRPRSAPARTGRGDREADRSASPAHPGGLPAVRGRVQRLRRREQCRRLERTAPAARPRHVPRGRRARLSGVPTRPAQRTAGHRQGPRRVRISTRTRGGGLATAVTFAAAASVSSPTLALLALYASASRRDRRCRPRSPPPQPRPGRRAGDRPDRRGRLHRIYSSVPWRSARSQPSAPCAVDSAR